MIARLAKISFPKFDGSLLREWIYRCEQLFSLDNTPPEMKIKLASIHMEGKALHWHPNFIITRYGIFPSWPEYVIAVSERFAEIYDDPLSELVSLKLVGDSIEVYLEKFECALTGISLPETHVLSIFLTNMNLHLAYQVRQFEVNTIAAAATKAKLQESSLLHTPTKPPRAPTTKTLVILHFYPHKNLQIQTELPLLNQTSSLK